MKCIFQNFTPPYCHCMYWVLYPSNLAHYLNFDFSQFELRQPEVGEVYLPVEKPSRFIKSTLRLFAATLHTKGIISSVFSSIVICIQ